ncbi:bacteriocin immunity protein [Lapidilactobacillus dextrinicus]|uniref:bacteriocin immunity protein n=1 Tax=Lapidilactobacillus dextrinicus TaxID=51664 RepID=UPI003F298F13
MSKLKWFSGGTDRAQQALEIIDDLLHDLYKNSENDTLQNLLLKYKYELEKQQTPVPFILSRMNIDIANIIVKNGLTLSSFQSSKLKQLTAISNIRYGF